MAPGVRKPGVRYPSPWALVPIPAGTKGPTRKGWNEPENCKLPPDWAGNVGLAHAYSGTCAVDFDRLDDALTWLNARGIDAQALLDAADAVQVSSGRPNRAKLLYALDTPLPSLTLADGALELRCATKGAKTVQDVLPPSIHPDTGKPYAWQLGALADLEDLPPLPPQLLQVWEQSLAPAPKVERQPHEAPTSLQHVEELLKKHDPDCNYDDWIEVLQAIHHETQGSEEGYALADAWSTPGATYVDGCVLPHWRSFKLDHPNPITLASLRKRETPEEIDAQFEDLGPEEAPADPKGSRFRPLDLAEFLKGRVATWIIKGVLPEAELVVVYGASGSGKTFGVLDMVASVARGIEWRDRRVKQGNVVYVCAEDAGGLRQRLQAYLHQFQVAPLDLPIRVIGNVPNLLERKDALELAGAIAPLRPRLIVIDTLSAVAAGGDENSGEDMGTVVSHCKGLHAATGATVVLIHHSGKDEAKGARGWSGLRAAADAELEVSRLGESRRISITKQKNAPDGAEFGFKLVPIPIGIDEDDEAITSCIVEPTAVTDQRVEKGPKGTVQKLVFAAARDLLAAQLDGSPVDVGAVIRAAKDRMTTPEGRDRRVDLAGQALDALVAGDFLHVENCRVNLP